MYGLYVHIPFCVKKCDYCDFYSLPGQTALIDRYVDAVLREAAQYQNLPFKTLYLGGGTPSLISPFQMERLMVGLRCMNNPLSQPSPSGQWLEATIEANPESATVEFLAAAHATGFNRISIGVQSLNDAELESVGRVHSSAQAVAAITAAHQTGFTNVSADLIIGLPGQTWASLKESLATLNNLEIEHLSVYCLSLEPGTPITANPPPNLPADDEQADLFEQAHRFLKEHRFFHYEISNFARFGYECQHNLNYWRGGEYVGLGSAAASHLGGKRFKNKPDLSAYLTDPTHQTTEVEVLPPERKAAEEAMLRLRLLGEGLDIEELSNRFGTKAVYSLRNRLANLADVGLLLTQNSRYRLPPSRVLTCNPILATVVEE